MVAAEIDKTQETFFSELPVGWRYDRLKDIVSLRNDKTSDKSSEQNYLELEDIEQGTGNLLSKKNTLDVESAIIRFKKGDVLFGKLRPYLEKYYYADFDGKCTGEILAFYPRGIQGHFLRYCVAAPWFIGKCNALAYGAKMPRVNWSKQLALFNIPIPSNSEQQRIAAYLDKTCAAIDKTMEAKQKQLGILDALRKSIIHKAVTRGLDDSVELKDSGVEWLGRIPRHWKVRRIKRDFQITLGKMLQSQQKKDKETEENYLRSANIKWDNVDLSDVRKMWFSPDEKKRLKLEYDDLLVSEGGDVGRTSIWKNELSDCFIQNAINRVRTRKKDRTTFLYYWLFFIKHIGYIDAIVSRITIAHLTAEKLEKIYYVRPPVAEQSNIVTFLDNKTKELDGLAENIVTQISSLQQYRKSLIHECVTGKRRITDDDVQGQL